MKLSVTVYPVLFLILFGLYSCKKTTAPPFPLNYTSKMAGIRTWSGITIRDILDTSGPTPVVHLDTTFINDTFAIVIINDKTIQAPDFLNISNPNNLYYQYDSSNSIAFFSPVGYNLIYNYSDNTIDYYGYTQDSAGYYSLILHSP